MDEAATTTVPHRASARRRGVRTSDIARGRSSEAAGSRAPAAEEAWQLLVEQIPAIVYVWGSAGDDPHEPSRAYTDLYVSPQVERLFGFTPAEWLERPGEWLEAIVPADRDRVLEGTTRSVEEGQDFSMEYRVVARDGRVVWVSDMATVVARDPSGRAMEFHGVMVDVTERKEAEEATRRAADDVQRIAADRNRLLAALVTAQEEERRRIAGEIHDDTIQVVSAARMRLATLRAMRPALADDEAFASLERTLGDAITRLRHLSFSLHPPALDTLGLDTALSMFLDESTRTLPGPRYELEVALDHEPGASMRTLLYRVAQELVVNARKHSDAHHVRIRIEDGDGEYRLAVTDDGTGFDPSILARPGDRLGLRSIRHRLELVGGHLEIETKSGVGTTLRCRVPESDLVRPAAVVAAAGGPEHAGRDEPLTPREHEVAALLALGHTNAEVAGILHLSVRTVEHHRAKIFKKLGVRSRAEMVRALSDDRARSFGVRSPMPLEEEE